MTVGGDNYTRILTALALNFEDVNVGRQPDGENWLLHGKIRANMSGLDLLAFLTECQEVGAHVQFNRAEVTVLGKVGSPV